MILLIGAARSAASDSVEERLDRQLARFDAARALIAERAASGAPPLTRAAWERLLAGAGDDALTSADLDALRARHEADIAHARDSAARTSTVDLRGIRTERRVEEFCREFPKGGLLHVHPHGTLDRATVQLLLEKANPRLDPRAILSRVGAEGLVEARGKIAFLAGGAKAARYRALTESERARVVDLFFWTPGTRSPQVAFALVDLLRESLSFDKTVYRRFFARARRHGARYVEFTKSFGAGDGERRRLRAISAWAAEHGVVVRFNLGFRRVRSEPGNLRELRAWLAARPEPLVRGIDLYGREARASQLAAGQRLYGALVSARERGATSLQMTAHAAGEGEPRNPRDALIVGAVRLGHGVGLRADPVALEYARRRRIAVETNLTSNLRLGYVDRLEDHPFLDFHRLGLAVSLSTDDEGMLETDISRECALAIAETDIVYTELRAMVVNSIATSFAEEEVKAALLREVEDELTRFEGKWVPRARRAAHAEASTSGLTSRIE